MYSKIVLCLSEKEELTQHVDARVHYGVNRCFLILESYRNNKVIFDKNNGKYIDITELKNQIDILYNNKGYKDYGFSKLSESELVRYTKVKDVLMQFFISSMEGELDAETIANKLFTSELKDFDWKPEEY